MNDPQIWTLLGVFSAIMFAALGVSTRYTVSTLRAEMRALDAKHDGRFDVATAQIAALAGSFDARFETVDARFDAVDARFDAVDARFDTVDARFDALESRLDARIDHVAEVAGIRLDAIDHRLGAVEDDLKIVKAHLLRHPAA